MATKQEIQESKAKAIAGGMPSNVADKVFKMDDHRENNGQVKSPEVFKMAINNQK